jgi:hypothetical protein
MSRRRPFARWARRGLGSVVTSLPAAGSGQPSIPFVGLAEGLSRPPRRCRRRCGLLLGYEGPPVDHRVARVARVPDPIGEGLRFGLGLGQVDDHLFGDPSLPQVQFHLDTPIIPLDRSHFPLNLELIRSVRLSAQGAGRHAQPNGVLAGQDRLER